MRPTFYRKSIMSRKYWPFATPSTTLCPLCHQPAMRLYQLAHETPWPPSGVIPPGWRFGCFKCGIIFIPPWSRQPSQYAVPPPGLPDFPGQITYRSPESSASGPGK